MNSQPHTTVPGLSTDAADTFERAHDSSEAAHGRMSSATEAAEERDARTASSADRPPTRSEEAAAERASAGVDTRSTAEHYEEMTSVGAKVRGEGRV